ncbi:uncharacterized protein LOC110698231 [Chenopodium quinoa]|uniref:uncharacterized protein LOC110698231 n=1 Tax=Chenopodium quinoa TaxID=63459 RepID=UPI000B78A009|nr:uncharacterized protein LOC110698231 [Chenopodium quinoa]
MQSHKGNNIQTSQEEIIKKELEMDIEKDLEGEIKEEIYRLALRLHRLYQHQRDKHASHEQVQSNKIKALSEVHISIKMEGGTKVEIKEIKKKPWDNNNIGRVQLGKNNKSSKLDHKRFDWANSLRSGPLKACHNMGRKKIQIGKEHPRKALKENIIVAKKQASEPIKGRLVIGVGA